MHSLGRADVKLRHAKGKTAENTMYACACALLSAHADNDMHTATARARSKGKKGMISRMSDQAAFYQS